MVKGTAKAVITKTGSTNSTAKGRPLRCAILPLRFLEDLPPELPEATGGCWGEDGVMFYSTRFFWRFLIMGLIVYVLITQVPWGSLDNRAGGSFQLIEQQVKRIKDGVMDGIQKWGK
jgi:hypothetical protein